MLDAQSRAAYSAYLRSAKWKKLRHRLIESRGRKCDMCRRYIGSRGLSVHHKTYERLGNERDGDLAVLCDPCHSRADGIRAEQGRRRSEAALEEARFAGWCDKVYGEDGYYDEDEAWDRYNAWLERRGDD